MPRRVTPAERVGHGDLRQYARQGVADGWAAGFGGLSRATGLDGYLSDRKAWLGRADVVQERVYRWAFGEAWRRSRPQDGRGSGG